MNNAMSTAPVKSLTEVRGFWNVEGCGTQFVPEKKYSKEFYEKFRAFRYETEWHLPILVPFAEARDRSVLEIGCGNGADGAMFALNGAHYTGVDLTEEAVQSTRAHFETIPRRLRVVPSSSRRIPHWRASSGAVAGSV